ncbi:MAG TPA: FAD-dependent monooxygenase [Burkholderiaceae bacterium]|nr:FAD-dependent monooxygenase [Burkholderiaceae bacterium]
MQRKFPVVIVGGGPVGLSMAILLQRFGIEFVLLERSQSTTDHPKARGTYTRTMEIFRQWGIDALMKRHALPDGSDFFSFCESMTGHEWGRTNPEPNVGHSPCWKIIQSQDTVEMELLAQARKSGVGEILFGHEFLHYDESANGIAVTGRHLGTGDTTTWQAQYLIAADGATSAVRRQAGIEMHGPATIAVMANEYWQADLSQVRDANLCAGWRVYAKDSPYPISTVLNTNGRDKWLTLMPVGREVDERAGERTDDEVVRLARVMSGVTNLDAKVINRSVWRMSRQVAASFRKGRVLLVGDSAHRFPPNGGYGMNSGIQDAHNLAWKLAFVLGGRAGARLLDSYDSERRPIAESNADFSLHNATRFVQCDEALRSGNADRIDFWIRDSDNHIHSIGQSLGFVYESGAVIPDGTGRHLWQPRYYEPSDKPGARFPHLWLDLARRHSTLDWFDREFVLVAGPRADAWVDAARAVSGRGGRVVQVRQLADSHEKDGLLLGLRGAALVRPDGHVAFRMPWTPSDPAAELAGALARLLD